MADVTTVSFQTVGGVDDVESVAHALGIDGEDLLKLMCFRVIGDEVPPKDSLHVEAMARSGSLGSSDLAKMAAARGVRIDLTFAALCEDPHLDQVVHADPTLRAAGRRFVDECNEPWNRVRPSQGVLLTLGEARELRERVGLPTDDGAMERCRRHIGGGASPDEDREAEHGQTVGTCGVCLHRVVSRALRCGHTWCRPCLLRLQHLHCPSCRQAFEPHECTRVFV